MSVYDQVSSIMDSVGIPSNVWSPILSVESGGNPSARAVSTFEDSVGLFQLNRMGGVGQGYSVAQLQDPAFNAKLAAEAMKPAYNAGVSKGLSGYSLTQYVAYNSGWPTVRGVSALQNDPVVKSYDAKLSTAYTDSLPRYKDEGYGGRSVAIGGSASPTTFQGQLASLQQAQAGGGGTMSDVKSIGLMVMICVLGVVLVYVGLKLLSGGETIIQEGKA